MKTIYKNTGHRIVYYIACNIGARITCQGQEPLYGERWDYDQKRFVRDDGIIGRMSCDLDARWVSGQECKEFCLRNNKEDIPKIDDVFFFKLFTR